MVGKSQLHAESKSHSGCILDFRFWILDCPTNHPLVPPFSKEGEYEEVLFENPKSKIPNEFELALDITWGNE